MFAVGLAFGCGSAVLEPDSMGFRSVAVPSIGFGWLYESAEEATIELFFGDAETQCDYPPGRYSEREYRLDDTHSIIVTRWGEHWTSYQDFVGEFSFLEQGGIPQRGESGEFAALLEIEDQRAWAIPFFGRLNIEDQRADSIFVKFIEGPWTGDTTFTLCSDE
jgi:hypothetical protein